MADLAVIAGNGKFPFLFLNEMKDKKDEVIVIALLCETDRKIEELGFKVFWAQVGKLGKIIKIMKDHDVKKAIMCGQVTHTKLFTELRLDFRAIKLLGSVANKKTDSLLGAVALEFESEGINLISSLTYMEKCLPSSKGNLSKSEITTYNLKDIDFGVDIAKKIAGLDIGQTVVVKDNTVVAVESIEGTDKCILRAHELAGNNVVVVKVNKPNQDYRFDVPVIGLNTFKILADVRAAAICFEAGKTLFFDKDECLKIANENNIGVYAI